ncbi:MAG: hypothetical protein K2G44_05765 [Clostridia bacterium]|nr:hypothetical protein [Clostridia bacterium]
MTYQEILQAESFLIEIEGLIAQVRHGQALFQEAKTLDGKISSSFSQYKSTGYSWNTISYSRDEPHRYCTLIGDALTIMQCALQSVLNKEPNYGKIKQVRLDLSRLNQKNKSNNSKQKRKLIIELVAKYSGQIKLDKLFADYVDHGDALFEEDKTDEIFNALIGVLNLYLDNLTSTNSLPEKSKGKNPTVQVFNSQTNTQMVAVNVQVSIENCLKELDDCETLSQEEITEIKAQLDDIQKLLKDKKGKKKTIREKISSALKWVADKGTDAMIALLPTLVMILTNLQGVNV